MSSPWTDEALTENISLSGQSLGETILASPAALRAEVLNWGPSPAQSVCKIECAQAHVDSFVGSKCDHHPTIGILLLEDSAGGIGRASSGPLDTSAPMVGVSIDTHSPQMCF